MKLYNINANLIQVIENLYNKATSAIYLNGHKGDWFRTTVGVRQGYLLSPTLFNIFLDRNSTDALEELCSLWHGFQCREDQTDDQNCEWYQH